MSIFISHSNLDEPIVKSFVENILIKGLSLDEKEIFCTSIQGMDVKSGNDFKATIKEILTSAKVIIQIISDNYRESEVCLNEMGAAWILDTKVIPFILDPVSFSNVGFVHNTTLLLRLNEYKDLVKFKLDHASDIGGKPNSDVDFNECLTTFLSQLNPFQKGINNNLVEAKIKQTVFDDYFGKFLDPEVNHYNLLIKAQPNLADCKAIFKDDIYEEVYSVYSLLYKAAFMKNDTWENVYSKDYFEYNKILMDPNLPEQNRKVSGGMLRDEITEMIKPTAVFYTIRFKNNGQEYGVSYPGWSYINGRWVLFPKPWRYLRSLIELKENKIVDKVYRWLRVFRVGKGLKKEDISLELFATMLIKKMKQND